MRSKPTVIDVGPDPAKPGGGLQALGELPHVVLSFDVEEHFRIEAAAGLAIALDLKHHYCERLAPSVSWLLDQLERRAIKATFFVLGQIAQQHAALVRTIHWAGHEVASHGWDHRRFHNLTTAAFRQDVR